MKKVADFIVEKYKFVMIIFVILTIIAAICSTKVTINTDLTKYLPDDSDMKVGMKIMEGEFGETTSDNTSIRIMFTGLSESEKEKMLDKLKDIKHVDSVAYDSESEDYNKDNYTKYDITVAGSYGSKEETAVEKALDTEFQNDKMTYVVDDTAANSIPKTVLLLALGILIIILLVMSESWFEPVLFIVTIMMAIILNLGTNLILGTVSNTTSSLGPILQLVLSMDYSIILMNRYHQELEVTDNRKEAMKTAWMHAFGSVSSSSLTTIVGLLALVFMSFKLGRDVGIVLAKGVFISVVSVLTFLPGITISATSLIQKTKKKAPVIPTDGLARFSYKFRKIITPAFIVLFIGVYFFQQKTPLTYSMNSEDEISKIFPKAQTVVLMYDNRDEDGITTLEEELESHDNVASVTGYGNMLGKKNSVGEMKEHIGNLSSVENEFIDSLDESLLGMLYYDYFSNGKVHPMLVSDFIKFLSNDVIGGETFGNQIDDSVKESISDLKKYADAEKLTKPMSIKELAKFMNLEEDSCKQLFLLYYIENGGADTGKMTVQQFLQFIVNDVAKDETYGSSIDKEQLSTIQKMMKYTDYNNMTSGKTYKEMADLLEIDESTAQMLYVYYYANNSGYTPGKMTLPELVSYLKNDVANNKAFSSQFDSKTVSKLEMLSKFTDSSVFTAQMTASELAKLFGVDKSMVKNIMMSDTSNLSGKKMSIYEFMGYMTKNVLTDKSYASSIDKNTKAQLESTYKLFTAVKEGKKFTAAQMASYIGMKEEQINQIYQLYFTVNPENSSNQTLTLQEFIHFVMNNVMTNASYASMISGEAASKIQTLNKLINAIVSNKKYKPDELYKLISGYSKELDKNKVGLLYLYHDSLQYSKKDWKLNLLELVDYLVDDVSKDARFEMILDDEMKDKLVDLQSTLHDAADTLKGERYSRVLLKVKGLDNMKGISSFYSDLTGKLDNAAKEKYYLIGGSAMSYEMSKIFDSELTLITLLTAVAIFVIVALTFRNLVLPAILVLIVQCGVYITVSVVGIQGLSLYYLALLMVECILMGSTIAYGILFTTYYLESRKTVDIKDALKIAYRGSIHTIMTSGSILVIVTGVLSSYFPDPSVSEICRNISIGALSAATLILFILPGILATMDKFIVKKSADEVNVE